MNAGQSGSRLLRLLGSAMLALAPAGPARAAQRATPAGSLGAPLPYRLTVGSSPMDQRPVDGILAFWSTPLDGAGPLALTRVFSFAEPLEPYQELPGGLQEAVLLRNYPVPARPSDAPAPGEEPSVGLQLEGVQVVSWSLRMVNGIPGALESVELSFTSAQPWRPFALTWPDR